MRCMVLAGGFAKRMWPLTKDFPKALLPVAGKPVIERILDKISGAGIGSVCLSTNSRFEAAFREWLSSYGAGDGIDIIVEPARREEEKFGSVRAIDHFIRERRVDDDVLIVGGDNLFSFSMEDFLAFARRKGTPAVAFFDIGDPGKVRGRFGVCVLDRNGRIREFQEKPQDPKSTLVSTCIYFFPRKALGMVSEYLEDRNNPDSPGFFISWLSQRTPVHGFVFTEKWYDIGSAESYRQANEDFGRQARSGRVSRAGRAVSR
jgi:glucose-1-phosphate thymidylyltransferase